MQKMLISLLLTITIYPFSTALAEGFDIGIGIGAVNSYHPNYFDLVLDAQVGYEIYETEEWNFGTQLHIISGMTSKSDINEDIYYGDTESTSIKFDSQALYFTARPENKWMRWLQLKAGVAHVDYYTVNHIGNDFGPAFGIGIVIGNEMIRLHILDYHRHYVDGESFGTFTFSIGVFIGGGGSFSFN